ncbi:phosphatidate cytidylyltransferase [Streptomyces sp. NPDC059894]|uniref:phosphatidate cytidylyltransferase n=1 Tax=unclassified Streptomyces TaxID=2593676 RepID=UPI00365C0ED2
MNDSSWGAPPHAGSPTGYWGPTDQGPVQGASPAGPAYDAPEAQQTRPMPIVPDVPADGGHQDDDRGAARRGGPLFRDEAFRDDAFRDDAFRDDAFRDGAFHGGAAPGEATHGEPYRGGMSPGGAFPGGMPRNEPFRDETPSAQPPAAVPQNPDPMPDAPQPAPAPKKSAGRDLGAAIGVGVGLGAVIVASLFVVKAVFIGVIAIAVVVGLWELTSRLQERKGIKAPLVPLALGGAAMVVAGYVRGAEGAWLAMALTALAVLVWRMTEPPEGYLRDVTAGVFAAFYVPFLATFVAMMLTAEDGAQRVLTFLLLTVVSDTGAYAVGWRFGRHKLAPRISPGKTREGLLGAVSFAMVAGALCMQFLIDDGTWWQGLLLGFAVAASATLGDLGESMIKRDLGIKDMGTLLPGHGGIMDRLDSLLPTAPVVWLLLVLFVGSA